MKFIQINHLILCAALFVMDLGTSRAAETAYEGFKYEYTPDSFLALETPPAPFVAWALQGKVAETGLTYPGLASAGFGGSLAFDGRGFLSLGKTINTGVQYISFLASNLGTSGLYSTIEFAVDASGYGSRFALGVSDDDGSESGGEFMARHDVFSRSGVLRDEATHLFVVRIDYTGGAGQHVLTWWLDPTVAAGEPTVTFPALTGDFAFSHLGLAKSGDIATPSVFDEIRLGLTWESALGQPPGRVYVPAVLTVSGQQIQLAWTAEAATNYTVRWSPDLLQWNNVAVGAVDRWTAPHTVGSAPKRFYRVFR